MAGSGAGAGGGAGTGAGAGEHLLQGLGGDGRRERVVEAGGDHRRVVPDARVGGESDRVEPGLTGPQRPHRRNVRAGGVEERLRGVEELHAGGRGHRATVGRASPS